MLSSGITVDDLIAVPQPNLGSRRLNPDIPEEFAMMHRHPMMPEAIRCNVPEVYRPIREFFKWEERLSLNLFVAHELAVLAVLPVGRDDDTRMRYLARVVTTNAVLALKGDTTFSFDETLPNHPL